MSRHLWVLAIFALGNSTDALLLARAQQQMQDGGLAPPQAAALLPLLWAWLHIAKSASSPWGEALSGARFDRNTLARLEGAGFALLEERFVRADVILRLDAEGQ
jgi:hypothetical protein